LLQYYERLELSEEWIMCDYFVRNLIYDDKQFCHRCLMSTFCCSRLCTLWMHVMDTSCNNKMFVAPLVCLHCRNVLLLWRSLPMVWQLMHLMSEYSHGEEHNHGKFEVICESNAIGVWTNLFATSNCWWSQATIWHLG